MHRTGTCRRLALSGLLLVTVSRLAGADDARFVRLDGNGNPLAEMRAGVSWPCVLDRRSGLVWEVKTLQPGLHHRERTFTWYQPDAARNGGAAGDPGMAACRNPPCNTHALVESVNRLGWCGAHDWRLPSREELRSLVDYSVPYPGPTVDTAYFPNTRAQFYWSATPSADDADEAWGIGFAFGFDYAYFKGDRVHLRLVRTARP